MMINTFEQALQLAKEFLATKERKNYYESQGIYEPCPDYVGMLIDLSDDMVSQIRTLKERYGEDFVNHLHEVIDDEDIISDMFYGEPVDIDLDHVRHQYAFNIHELKPDGTVSDCSLLVELKDEEYARLLAWHLFDEHLTINILRQRDRNLYDSIMYGIDAHYYELEGYLDVDNPYVATLDEAKEDAETIIRQHDIIRDGGYHYVDLLR